MNQPCGRAEALRQWLHSVFGHEPRELAGFERALTHRSAAGCNNERLEFLGDAVLGLITAQYLYERFVDADEGSLSRLRARVVNGESLAQLAAQVGVGDWLVLGPGELKTGGQRRESILADALEALVGAVYLDGGMPAASAGVLRVLAPALAALELPAELKDAKTRLQEQLQAKGLPLPQYLVDAVEGELHAQMFRVTCEVASLSARASASASSRRRAEQAAASQVLELLQAKS